MQTLTIDQDARKISLHDALGLLDAKGITISSATIHRHALRGVRGADGRRRHLPVLKVGQKYFTTEAGLWGFYEDLGRPSQAQPSHTARTMQRDHEAAERQLDREFGDGSATDSADRAA